MIIVNNFGDIFIGKNFEFSSEYLYFYNMETKHSDAIEFNNVLKIHDIDFSYPILLIRHF